MRGWLEMQRGCSRETMFENGKERCTGGKKINWGNIRMIGRESSMAAKARQPMKCKFIIGGSVREGRSLRG